MVGQRHCGALNSSCGKNDDERSHLPGNFIPDTIYIQLRSDMRQVNYKTKFAHDMHKKINLLRTSVN